MMNSKCPLPLVGLALPVCFLVWGLAVTWKAAPANAAGQVTPEKASGSDGKAEIVLPYDLSETARLWSHVMLESPLGHVEIIDADGQKVRLYGRGPMGRTGLLSRWRVDPTSASVRVLLQEAELGAALALYGGTGGWERSLELRVEKGNATVWTATAFAVGPGGETEQLGQIEGIKLPIELVISASNSVFEVSAGGRTVWRGRLKFDLPAPRVFLRACGDWGLGPRERGAVFGVVHLRGVAAEEEICGQVVDDRGRPVPYAWVHVAGDPFAHTTAAADGTFSLHFVPLPGDKLVCGAEGYGFFSHTLGDLAGTDPVILVCSTEPTPRPEYPRPEFDRSSGWWQNLNGVWQFAPDPRNVGTEEKWESLPEPYPYRIRVPFPWTSLLACGEETMASGIHYTGIWGGYAGAAWYRRTVHVRDDLPTGADVLLKFGAVNFSADVYWDGTLVGHHEGGFDPFAINLGPVTPGSEHTLAVRVYFPQDVEATGIPVGKQGWWFSHAPGIWQTVWLEAVSPLGQITRLHVTPKVAFASNGGLKEGTAFTVRVDAEGCWEQIQLQVLDAAGQPVGGSMLPRGKDKNEVDIGVANPRLWDTDSPYLYTVTAALVFQGQIIDKVSTYAGLREVRVDWAPGHDPSSAAVNDQYKYVYLNNKPLYVLGVLDQGYNPWGIYTYPSYGPADRPGSIMADVAAARQLGYNLVRLHIKQNEPLWLYEAARTGLLVWDEIPCQLAALRGQAWERWMYQFNAQYERDYNNPAIIIRSLFNEAWGASDISYNPQTQQLIREAVALQRKREPHRLVIDNSAVQALNNRHTDTDINDEHIYLPEWRPWRETLATIERLIFPGSTYNFHVGSQTGQPYIVSEFSATSGNTLAIRMFPKVAGYVKVNLADQEWERGRAQWNRGNALSADRSWNQLDYAGLPAEAVTENAPDVVVFDAPPQGWLPDEEGAATVGVYVSSFERTPSDLPFRLAIRVVAAREARGPEVLQDIQLDLCLPPFSVTRVTDIVLPADEDILFVTVVASLSRGERVVARNVGMWKRR